jgi:NAD(P)-dependent dehydrogenase (short-subunit alcohol dehydrogenase family)
MRILVTGAGRAIGQATAIECARRGHEVVATARDPQLLADLDVAARLPLDVTDLDSVNAALDAAGELDAVVNNAALQSRGPLEGYPLDRLQAIVDTNTYGPLRIAQALIPSWRERGSGVFVNVSSIQGQVATPLEGAYAASKYALEALSETMHYELGHFGIRVVIIQPGYIAPGMKRGAHHEGPGVYAPLIEAWEGSDTKVVGPGGRPGPEIVALAIADAIEDPATPLRVPVGADADLILGTRKALDDAAFEAAMRTALELDW